MSQRGKSKRSRAGRKDRLIACDKCDQICCRTTAIEVEGPRSFRDWEDFLFYLHHFDTEMVIVDDAGRREWYLQLMSPCRFLDARGRCTMYEHRPETCREYDERICERNRSEQFTYIRSPAELLKYLEKKGPARVLKRLKENRVPPGGFARYECARRPSRAKRSGRQRSAHLVRD
ncbi:MAG: YkgJ family cysteine cluster protein [Planctomycetota bacterium]